MPVCRTCKWAGFYMYIWMRLNCWMLFVATIFNLNGTLSSERSVVLQYVHCLSFLHFHLLFLKRFQYIFSQHFLIHLQLIFVYVAYLRFPFIHSVFFSPTSSALEDFLLFLNLLYWCYLWCFSSRCYCYGTIFPPHFVNSKGEITERGKNWHRWTENCRQLDCRHFG